MMNGGWPCDEGGLVQVSTSPPGRTGKTIPFEVPGGEGQQIMVEPYFPIMHGFPLELWLGSRDLWVSIRPRELWVMNHNSYPKVYASSNRVG